MEIEEIEVTPTPPVGSPTLDLIWDDDKIEKVSSRVLPMSLMYVANLTQLIVDIALVYR
jgi:hypothetical protein